MTGEDLLSAALEALGQADAKKLERLAEAAPEAELPRTAVERARLQALHRTLGRLLQLTRRNLWLLGGVYCEPCGYGAPRDSRDS